MEKASEGALIVVDGFVEFVMEKWLMVCIMVCFMYIVVCCM